MIDQKHRERIDLIQNRGENQRCCDCFDKISKSGIASLIISPIGQPIGALCCYACSKAHKSLGRQYCRVLDIHQVEACKLFRMLDYLIDIPKLHHTDDFLLNAVASGNEDEVEALERGGNKIVNAVFESNLAWDYPRPKPSSGVSSRKSFSQKKYVERKFFSHTVAKEIVKSLSVHRIKTPMRISARKLLGSDLDDHTERTLSSNFGSFACDDARDFTFYNDSDENKGGNYNTDNDDLGYEQAVPDSEKLTREASNYKDTVPDAEIFQSTRRSTRRFESLGSQTQTREQLGYEDTTLTSDVHMGGKPQKPRRCTSLGYSYDTRPGIQALHYEDTVPDAEIFQSTIRSSRRLGSLGSQTQRREQLGHEDTTPTSDKHMVGKLQRSRHRTSLGNSYNIRPGIRIQSEQLGYGDTISTPQMSRGDFSNQRPRSQRIRIRSSSLGGSQHSISSSQHNHVSRRDSLSSSNHDCRKPGSRRRGSIVGSRRCDKDSAFSAARIMKKGGLTY
jgi:hypothetical protein